MLQERERRDLRKIQYHDQRRDGEKSLSLSLSVFQFPFNLLYYSFFGDIMFIFPACFPHDCFNRFFLVKDDVYIYIYLAKSNMLPNFVILFSLSKPFLFITTTVALEILNNEEMEEGEEKNKSFQLVTAVF